MAAAAAATGAGSSSTAATDNVLLAPLESSISVSGDEVSIMTSDTLLVLVRREGGLGILLETPVQKTSMSYHHSHTIKDGGGRESQIPEWTFSIQILCK